MENVNRKISYIEGLIEGLDLNKQSKEGKVIVELIELCKSMAQELEHIRLQVEDQETYIEAVDEDLADLEEMLFEEEDECDCDYEYEFDEDDDDVEDEDIEYLELKCPHCERMVLVDQDIFARDVDVEVTCPECHNKIMINDNDPIITKHVMNMDDKSGEIHYYQS